MTNASRMSKKKGLTVLSPEDNFRFECNPGISCFTHCCQDITIFLSPYDIIRMKTALNMRSTEFLSSYSVCIIGDSGLPVVVLKMAENEEKTCPFVTTQGCSIYKDRPWSCRIYPLQPESNKITEKVEKQYYSIMDVSFCRGLTQDKTSTVKNWLESQGVGIYHEMETFFKKIMSNSQLISTKITNKKIQDMFYMACYDLDRFRRFVFESSFLDVYNVDAKVLEKIQEDDIELYKLAMQWLEHGLLGRQALEVKPEVIKAKKQELGLK